MAPLFDDLKQASLRVVKWGRKSVDALAVTIDQQGELARLSAQLRRLNRERDQTISEIGKKTYALYTRGKVNNQDVLADCQKVDRLNAEAAQIREEMDRLRQGAAKDPLQVELKDEAPLVREAVTPATPEEPAEAPRQAAPQQVATTAVPAAPQEPRAPAGPPAGEEAGKPPEPPEELRPAPDGCADE